jgi:hypothetical protein
MTREDIIRMAREAGAMFDHMTWVERDLAPVFEHFANLVAAAEREACAELCETLRLFHCEDMGYSELPYKECAFNIRERGAP